MVDILTEDALPSIVSPLLEGAEPQKKAQRSLNEWRRSENKNTNDHENQNDNLTFYALTNEFTKN
jgi:hypothetical protein